jgi:hypothetical protein
MSTGLKTFSAGRPRPPAGRIGEPTRAPIDQADAKIIADYLKKNYGS